MANVGSLAGRLASIIKNVTPTGVAKAVPIRCYSMYPPSYVKPIFKKPEQEQLKESDEYIQISHKPILPATNYDTSSEFHDHKAQKFTRYLMREGKKAVARRILSGAFENIKRMQLQKYHKAPPEEKDKIILDPIKILHTAIINSTPVMELVKMKKGGVKYQVPVPILENRQTFLGMNWLIEAAKLKERTTPFELSLARELLDAANNTGQVVRKKQDLHRQCDANRAYAHYRWS